MCGCAAQIPEHGIRTPDPRTKAERLVGRRGLLGKYQATNAGTTVDGRIVIVARRREGRWLIAVHETVVRDQPD
jgi:hypothetical protein